MRKHAPCSSASDLTTAISGSRTSPTRPRSTWCVPCRAEFPDLIKLYGKYRDRGLELILISVDFAEQRRQVEAFLKENGVTFPTYINAEESYEDLIGFLAPDWIGGLPTTFVIDRKGRLTRSLVGGQNYEVFHKAVAPLL